MSIMTTEPLASAGTDRAEFSFEVQDVTGTRMMTARVQPSLPAGAVATLLARELSLPDNVPWTLRSETRGSTYLDDRQEISRQIDPGEKTVLTPRSHLGCR